MYPQGLFGLNPFQLWLPISTIVFTTLIVTLLRRENQPLWPLLLLQLSIGIVALLGAKLFSLAVRNWQLYPNIIDELANGWRYPGIVIAFVLLGPVVKKMLVPQLSLFRYADVVAITAAFLMASFRVSCFMAGCCTGAISQSWLALAYAPASQVWHRHLQHGLVQDTNSWTQPVFPLHLLLMAASLSVGIFLVKFDRHRQYDGQVFLLYLISHETLKAILESFRTPFISSLQSTSLTIAAMGAIMLLIIARTKYATNNPPSLSMPMRPKPRPKKLQQQGGFTLIELVSVIVLLGTLSATAVPKYLSISENAHDATATTTSSALKTAVDHLHLLWLIRGEEAVVIVKGDNIAMNSGGWPGPPGTATPTAAQCVTIWDQSLETDQSVSATADGADWLATGPSAGLCRYQYQRDGGGNYLFEYDLASGAVEYNPPPPAPGC